jgi:hypothetical protein
MSMVMREQRITHIERRAGRVCMSLFPRLFGIVADIASCYVSDPHQVRTFAWIIGSRAELLRQAIMGFEKGANTLEKTKKVLHLTLALLGIGEQRNRKLA